jgi:hypothetical protein
MQKTPAQKAGVFFVRGNSIRNFASSCFFFVLLRFVGLLVVVLLN